MGKSINAFVCTFVMVMKTCFGSESFDLDFTSLSKPGFVQLDVLTSFNDLSVCLWLQSVESLRDNGTQGIVSYHNMHDQSFLMTINRERLVMKISQSKDINGLDIPFIQSSCSLTDRKWRHLCVVWDREHGILTLYVDGKMDGTVTFSAWPSGQVISGGGRLTIGKVVTSPNQGPDQSQPNSSFRGILSDLNIWDKAMNFEQVLEMFEECSAYCFMPANILTWNQGVIHNIINGSLIIRESVRKCRPSSFNSNFMQVSGKRLQGHVIESKRTHSIMACAHLCLINLACKSFNVAVNKKNVLVCELNRIIKDQDPGSFQAQTASNYAEKKFKSCRDLSLGHQK